MSFAPCQCDVCVHNLGQNRCRAFPDGIPVSILMLKHDHRVAYPGDRGLRFEVDPFADPEDVAGIIDLYETLGRTGAVAPELQPEEPAPDVSS